MVVMFDFVNCFHRFNLSTLFKLTQSKSFSMLHSCVRRNSLFFVFCFLHFTSSYTSLLIPFAFFKFVKTDKQREREREKRISKQSYPFFIFILFFVSLKLLTVFVSDAKLDVTFFTKFNYLNFSLIYVYIYWVYVCMTLRYA